MTTSQIPRSRLVEWSDPTAIADQAMRAPGLEFLQAIVDGTLPQPPMATLLRSRLVAVTRGSATFTCDVDESMCNPIGSIHGGVVCTLLDSVLGCAVHTTLPVGHGYTSIDTNVQFQRGLQPTSGPLTAIGRVTKPGRRVAFAEGEVADARGVVVARGYGTLLVIAPESEPGQGQPQIPGD
ncbi:PaaI family thioesterase [Nocardia alni]|uniref:PaaI family thioesterase n=1 Tax=Nocardia alni TaxID=2815723 RepID=UPI001C22692E|nr:PaaI family thioesterase [Nocardia alni]